MHPISFFPWLSVVGIVLFCKLFSYIYSIFIYVRLFVDQNQVELCIYREGSLNRKRDFSCHLAIETIKRCMKNDNPVSVFFGPNKRSFKCEMRRFRVIIIHYPSLTSGLSDSWKNYQFLLTQWKKGPPCSSPSLSPFTGQSSFISHWYINRIRLFCLEMIMMEYKKESHFLQLKHLNHFFLSEWWNRKFCSSRSSWSHPDGLLGNVGDS